MFILSIDVNIKMIYYKDKLKKRKEMNGMNEFLTPEDIQDILKVKLTKAYAIIRELNNEMKKDGYKVVQGKVNKRKFEERYIYKGVG